MYVALSVFPALRGAMSRTSATATKTRRSTEKKTAATKGMQPGRKTQARIDGGGEGGDRIPETD